LSLKISQGITKSSFHSSKAKFAVISVHDFSLASITSTPSDNPATISFLMGKL
tara:strand:- start:59 stop:217 length:159 start_codon:yes stop_codon:yes gene_type:complete